MTATTDDLPSRGDGFVVVGDVMVDIVCQVDTAPQTGTDTPACISTHGGGGGANVAAWLAHRGPLTHFIGRTGKDRWGSLSIDLLSEAGVTCHVVRDDHASTGTCIVLVTPDGERTMLPDVGANAHLAPSDIPDEVFVSGRHLHVSGYTLLKSGSRLAGLAALDLARRRGMTTSIDVSSTAPLRSVGPDAFAEWTRGVDICFANAEEAALLTGHVDPDDSVRALAQMYNCAVVKRGSYGAIAMTRSEQGEPLPATTPAVTVDVVDTTGAGDAFAAGFLIPWVQGRPVPDCMATATALAGRAVAGVGGRP